MVRKLNNIFLVFSLLFIALLLAGCDKENLATDNEDFTKTGSTIIFNGVSYTGPKYEVQSSEFDPIAEVNADYVCLMPFAFGNMDSTFLRYESGFQWWGERKEGIIKCTQYAQDRNLKIFLKPHVWFSHGIYTGDFELSNDDDWIEWELNYLTYIVDFAQLADSLQIEMYGIGLEFDNFIEERPEFWNYLIDSVRKVYSGKIIYASNWDNYQNIPFWNKLDYIGINSYFPLSENKTPEVYDMLLSWETYCAEIEALSKLHDKKIVFTEYGYKSIDYTALTPWDPDKSGNVNLRAQQNAYEALYQRFWGKEWFAGGFLWKWYSHHETSGGADNKDYTPQNKPVEEIIKNWYNK